MSRLETVPPGRKPKHERALDAQLKFKLLLEQHAALKAAAAAVGKTLFDYVVQPAIDKARRAGFRAEDFRDHDSPREN